MRKIFTLLMALMLCVPAFADVQFLSNPNKKKANTLSGTDLGAAVGWSVQCMNTEKNIESGSTMTIAGESNGYIPMKFSNGAEHVVTLPKGCVATKVTLYTTINKDAATNRPCYWAQVGNNTYTAENATIINNFKNFKNPDVQTFTIDPANSFTIKNAGEQPFVVIKVEYSTSSDTRKNAPISWSVAETKLKVGEALATVPQIVNTENLTLSYNSDNTAIATVDEATGVITYQNPTEPGVCHISATYTAPDETSTYKTTTVTTTITVESSIVEVVAHQWVAYETQASFPLTVKVDTKDAFAANVDILSDGALKVSTVYAATQAKYGTTMFGYPFETGAQLGRVDKAPSADNLTGTEKAGNSPLVVTPAKDLKFVVFIRRQAVEQGEPVVTTEGNTVTTTHMWGMSENDGKGIYAVSQTAPADKLPQQQIFGSYMNEQAQGSNDYLCAAVVWELKAGETYTIWTRGTTICMFALGYILPEQPEAPAAPQIFIGETEHTEGDIDLSKGDVTLTFTAAEGHNVYYNFTPAVTEPETPAAAPAAEPVATLEHNGETFTLVPAEGLTLTQNGTLKVLAHNPATDARSEVVVRGVSGGTTAITEIEAAGAEAVYYNLQGQRIAQPAQGLYIRVQNGKAQKVMVK